MVGFLFKNKKLFALGLTENQSFKAFKTIVLIILFFFTSPEIKSIDLYSLRYLKNVFYQFLNVVILKSH